MALLSVSNLSKSFGLRHLFSQISFTIEEGERVGLIGPNGAGKSTLLRILSGDEKPDAGDIAVQRGMRVAFLQQVPEFLPNSTIMSCLLETVNHVHDAAHLTKAYELIAKLSLGEPEQLISTLSGGWQKRVALARELMCEPDLLLLDEPTNHLDVESILWLENFLARANFATITITHDRSFLQNISTRILELDKRNAGGLLSVKGNYAKYLEVKEQLMNAQEKMESTLKNTLRRETEWLRAGVKARTTKQYARIERAHELADQVGQLEYRNASKNIDIDFVAEGNHPKKLIEAKNIAKAYADKVLFQDLDILISPGMRLGLLGSNGCGKSTLLRVLLAQEKPDTGKVFISDKVKIAYFQQNRDALDPQLSLIKTLAPHGDQVIFRGRAIHVRGYLDKFLFTSEQMNMQVGQLSGGEQSRILIAKLMLQDANVLVLDEPTNDLDLSTLNVLEECLCDFDGAVIFVTHDRTFLERVATKILAFHPQQAGKTEFFASLEQWQNWFASAAAVQSKKVRGLASAGATSVKKASKLSYKDERDLSMMEGNIHAAEAKLAALQRESELPEHASNSAKLIELSQQIAQAQSEIDALFERWAELEQKKNALSE